jgi:hypothetical protein
MGPDPDCTAGGLPEPKEIDAFRPFFHSDLMLFTGLSEALVRLFLPSSVESSEKRLDGGRDAASTWLVTLVLRPCKLAEESRSGGALDSGSDAPKDVEA